MKATQFLPVQYKLDSSFDLKNKKLLMWLNIIGLFLIGFFFLIFSRLLRWLRPDAQFSFSITFENPLKILLQLAAILLVIAAVLTLHEAVHGVFFWLFSRHKPTFGFSLAYAYAAMPDWYFPRNQYLWIGMAPFILLSLLGVGLMVLVPANTLGLLLIALVMNASGAVGDLAVLVWLSRKPRSSYALDKADSIEIYLEDNT